MRKWEWLILTRSCVCMFGDKLGIIELLRYVDLSIVLLYSTHERMRNKANKNVYIRKYWNIGVTSL